MKISSFWVLLFVFGIAFMFLGVSSSITGSYLPGKLFAHSRGDCSTMNSSRKLRWIENNMNKEEKIDEGAMNMEDYYSIDPSPSSKASTKPGPIEHGAPIIPYIPKPSPPSHPKHGD